MRPLLLLFSSFIIVWGFKIIGRVLIDVKCNFRREKDDAKLLFLYIDKWHTKRTYIYNDKQLHARLNCKKHQT